MIRILILTGAAALALAACDDTDTNTVSTDANLVEDDEADSALGGDSGNDAAFSNDLRNTAEP